MPRDMKRRTLVHLVDVLDSVQLIEGYLEGLTVDGFLANPMTIDAVQHRFVLTQEALSRVERDSPELFARIGDTHQIRGFRNRLVHEYEEIDPATVFRIAESSLPILRDEVQQLVGEIEADLR